MEEVEITREITGINIDGVEYIRQQNPDRPQTDQQGRWIFVRADGQDEDDEVIVDDITSEDPQIYKRTFTLTSVICSGQAMIEEEEENE